MDFVVPADYSERKRKSDKYLDQARKLKKSMEHESDGDTNCNWGTRYSHQRIGTGTGRLEKKRKIRDHPNYSIVEINQNTKESPGDLKRLAVIQTSVEDHQLTLI